MEVNRDDVVECALELVGCPSLKYQLGHPELGTSPDDGFDCSGFIVFVLEKVGLHIPNFVGMDGITRPARHASELWDNYGVLVHEALASPGDLVFFSRHGTFPTHIGLLVDAESYVHAPGKDGTEVEVRQLEHQEIINSPGTRKLYAHNPIGYKALTNVVQTPTYRYHQAPIP